MNITVTNDDILNGMYNNTCAFTLALKRLDPHATMTADTITIGKDTWRVGAVVRTWLGYEPGVFMIGMSERAFNTFITKRLPDLKNMARDINMAGENHYEELVSRVLETATKQLADIDESQYPWTWLTNKLKMEWLYMQRDMAMQKADYNADEFGPMMDESKIEGASWLQRQNHETPVGMAKDVWEAVSTLPPIQQRVIYLIFVEGYTETEVAELVEPLKKVANPGDQRKRINWHVYKAIKALRKQLAAYDNTQQMPACEKTSSETSNQSA